MSEAKVVVTERNLWPWLGEDPLLDAAPLDLVFVEPDDRDALLTELTDAAAYVGVHFDTQMAEAVANADGFLLQIAASGTEHIPCEARRPGFAVRNAGGHDRSIAEHVLMVTLAAHRRLLWADGELRQGRWRSRLAYPELPSFDTLETATIGLVGYGSIAREVANVFSALGAGCIAVTKNPDLHVAAPVAFIGGYADIARVFDESDVVVLACPLTEDTTGLVDAGLLRLLGPRGLLVNVARGAVVDEQALFAALENGDIGAAALDVWSEFASRERRMPSALPFHRLDNVILTPHYSATAERTYRDRAGIIARNLVAHLTPAPATR